MCWFFKPKTNYVGEMHAYLKEYMLSSIKENPGAADSIVPIFSDAELMLRELPEREIAKTMRVNGVNVECCALNILQNVAMTKITQQSPTDFLKGETEDPALQLYREINEIKLEKKYISKRQYEENELLAAKLSLKAPLGSWF